MVGLLGCVMNMMCIFYIGLLGVGMMFLLMVFGNDVGGF